MRYAYGGEGRERTPDQLANRWRKKDTAFICDVLGADIQLAVATLHSNSADNITIQKTKEYAYSGYDEDRAMDWVLTDYSGEDQTLPRLVTAVFGVTCVPPLDSSRRNRPYTDMLFKLGELRLTPSHLNGSERSFGIGRVVGLSIIANDATYPVWAP